MATIVSRKRKSGTVYQAKIRIRKNGVTHTESETFEKKSLAKTWADRREAELKAPGVLERLAHVGITVGQVLRWYKEDYEGNSTFGRSKLNSIDQLINRDEFAVLDAMKLTSGQLVAHARKRRKEGTGPATVNNDFIWLRTAMRAVRIGRDMPLELQAIDDAAFICRKEGLISKAEQRDRRPTIKELNQLLDYFSERDGRAETPMVEIVQFAIFSSRRQDEICRIRWADVDEKRNRVLVRDMKHPKKLVDTWVSLPDKAWTILQRQPKTNDRIFPYNSKTVSSNFTRSCKFLGIKDLRFHDLRHECISWLFELGWEIPRVAQVSGHKAWTSLQRYTHLEKVGDKYKGFKLR
jgi:integrase